MTRTLCVTAVLLACLLGIYCDGPSVLALVAGACVVRLVNS
jgi:hypothetical protein